MTITKNHIFSFIFLIIFSVIQLVMFFPLAQSVEAQTSGEVLFNNQIGVNEIGQAYGNNKTDIRIIIAKFILVALGFLAIIFLVLILYAGFRYMTAAGNQDQTKKAISQIRDATIGLFIVLASWALTNFILTVLSRSIKNMQVLY